MANPTVWETTTKTALIASSTTVATLTLLPEMEYELTHTTFDIDSTTGGAETIMLAVGSATAEAVAGAGKLFLVTGQTLRIGPGVSTLKYDAVAGAPVFNITAHPHGGGEW